jgi:serine/threonine-protein kinase
MSVGLRLPEEGAVVNEREIFDAAVEFADEAERAAYLEQACAGDASLKQHIERMLRVCRNMGAFLESPAVDLVASEGPPGCAGRFRLGQELARGGMGVVYCACDESLGRDVAVKVLHECYEVGSLVGQRFLDEARITAQLQHPGIPPVFEVGRLDDGRPYLAMKLINGRTLAELLKERREPASDRGRFLAMFEQICQAVAYAHSKHVLHRDLKPANVMVGAFGEVQVMDWGLAKLLAPCGGTAHEITATETACETRIVSARELDSATLPGSVLGTPAYMSPEQAGGELDRLDERADVFGLGAILCIILTGEPPYTGKSSDEVRLLAIRGMLAGAYARLDQCGADAKLVELCRACLSAEREGRPRDAGAVAATVAGYLAGVEERARQAELERAAGEVRAAEQRKRRRVQFALAATLLVLLGLVGFGLWWQASAAADRAARNFRVAAGVAEALREARERVEEAWKLPDFPDRMQHATDAAVAALRRGDELASGGAPEEITRDLVLARREVEELARHTRLIHDISAMRHKFAEESSGQGWSESMRQLSPRYVEALKTFGLDPLHDPVDEVAQEIVSSRFRDFLLDELLGWNWHAYHERLAQVTRLVRQKSGGAYARWQELLDARDVPGLVALASSSECLSLGPRIMNAVFRDLRDARQLTACRTLLRAALERYPHEEFLYFDLAGVCLDMNPPEYAEAISHSSAATLLRPDSAAFQLRLGDCYAGLGSYAQAAVCYRKSIELGHGPVVGYLRLGGALAKEKDWDGALAAVRQVTRLQHENAAARLKYAMILHAAGKYSEALQELVDFMREQPDLAEEPRSHFRYNAGCSALRYAEDQGVDAPPQADRPAYRKQALDFLTTDLAAIRNLSATDTALVHRYMQHWLEDSDLASVRGAEAIAQLPPDERDDWNRLWAEVRALRDETAPQSATATE